MTGSSAPAPFNSSSLLTLGGVLFLAAAVRGVVLLAGAGDLQHDTDAYRVLAETLRDSHIFGFGNQGLDPPRPTAFRPPLYPLLLSPLVVGGQLSLGGVAVLHWLLGVITVALVWWVAVQWGLGRGAVAAALFTACDPILLHQANQLMTETLAATLAIAALAMLTRWQQRPGWKRACLAGIVIGLACLSRPTFLPWLLLVVVAVWWVGRRTTEGWKGAAAVTLGAALILAPWGARNAYQFGHWKLTTTHGGYTLLLGNNPLFYRHLREKSWGEVWRSEQLDAAWLQRQQLSGPQDDLLAEDDSPEVPASNRAAAERTEFEDDELAYQFARRFMADEPAMFAYACLHRVIAFWGVLPHRVDLAESPRARLARYAVATWYVLLFGAVAIGLARIRGELLHVPWLWGLLLCLVFTLVHSLYWSNMRMRAPLMPFLTLMASAAFWPPRRPAAARMTDENLRAAAYDGLPVRR